MKSININESKAKSDRDYISIIGGGIFLLETKIRKNHRITLSDLKNMKSSLAKLDKHNLQIWEQLIKRG